MMVQMIAIMPFRRRLQSSIRPVHRIKHVIDIQGGLVAGTQTGDKIVNTKDAPVLANVNEVETGATVNGFFLNVQIAASGTAALANVYLIVYKNPGNNIVAPTANQVGSSDDKRYVIHQEMIMSEKNTTAIPRTLFKGVIVVPKGFRRCGPNDTWYVALLAPGVTFDYCFQCIYKEFR